MIKRYSADTASASALSLGSSQGSTFFKRRWKQLLLWPTVRRKPSPDSFPTRTYEDNAHANAPPGIAGPWGWRIRAEARGRRGRSRVRAKHRIHLRSTKEPCIHVLILDRACEFPKLLAEGWCCWLWAQPAIPCSRNLATCEPLASSAVSKEAGQRFAADVDDMAENRCTSVARQKAEVPRTGFEPAPPKRLEP